jgi:hypothetical protein
MSDKVKYGDREYEPVKPAPTKTKEKGKPIDLRLKIEIYATGKHPELVEGTPIRLHPETAEVVIKRGLATSAKPAGKAK